MSDTIQVTATATQSQPSNFGRVYIGAYTGSAIFDPGTDWFQEYIEAGLVRPATEDELQALRSIPEFSAHLDRVRGGK